MFFSCTQSTITDELAFASLRQAARRHLRGEDRARSKLAALEADATTSQDVGATSSFEESSDRVNETPYTHLLHQRGFLLLIHATSASLPSDTLSRGAESTSSTSCGM